MAHLSFANLECNSLDEFSDVGTNNGTIAASNEQAKTGTYSLKANVTIAAGHGTCYSRLQATTAELYIRFYYYLPTATYNNIADNAGDFAHIFYTLDAGWASVIICTIINVAGTVELHYDHKDATDTCACPTRDVWHCIELYHKRDAAAGAWEWWIDGVSEGSGAGVNTGANNIKYPEFGIPSSVGMTGAIYEDNIVIATSRIYELMGNIPQGSALRSRKEAPQGWVI